MIDFDVLPLYSKLILITGFCVGIFSFIFTLRYPIILILMKLSPEYRRSIKRILDREKKRKIKTGMK
ncbi:MAG: hypothetical protein OIN88_08240 [Candidatus Methanoperedens sp.]|nr:hypothetical protein [Candidatus Methanoperedens sp.]MCZ7359405.1 hypothetical protein [Candidatus Methanoperedens sp.]HLB72075.1 hypothetical protein [Candidatus Methanoperedens sp.]